ncbi:MAG: hypothetical protein HUJ60_04060, partial [Bacilli bacterium]|nr:hypothetical protein [Bacilli bacterium]
MHNIGGLFITALVELGIAIGLLFIRKAEFYRKWKIHPIVEQIIIGILMAGVSFLATYLAWPEQGNANVRDASVLIAGLIFGPVAGLVSGVLGGVLRFLYTFVFFLQGEVTAKVGSIAVACALGTLFAGFVGAGLRRLNYRRGKRPSLLEAFSIATIVELIHMVMIFVSFMVAEAM